MMQEVVYVFETGIRAHPQDWHMLQRVFIADLDPGWTAGWPGGISPPGLPQIPYVTVSRHTALLI